LSRTLLGRTQAKQEGDKEVRKKEAGSGEARIQNDRKLGQEQKAIPGRILERV